MLEVRPAWLAWPFGQGNQLEAMVGGIAWWIVHQSQMQGIELCLVVFHGNLHEGLLSLRSGGEVRTCSS
jgi:hypothetical protein